MTSWLEFDKSIREPGKKTDHYYVVNRSTGTTVGQIRWYGGFRKYVFEPYDNIIFDANCLQEISTFLIELMVEWKQNKKLKQS